MHSLAQRILIGLSLAAIAAGAVAAGGPAHAVGAQIAAEGSPQDVAVQSEAQAASELRTVGYPVDLVGTPRRGAPALARLAEGERLAAMCAFANDGRDWVKVHHLEQFGFVPADAVGGAGNLPSTCPSEIETIDYLVLSHYFQGTDSSVTLPAAACPASWPMLVRVNHPNHAFPVVHPGVRVANADTGIVAAVGNLTDAEVNGVSYAAGIKGGSVTNFGFRDQLGQVWLTCTNNVDKAYRRR